LTDQSKYDCVGLTINYQRLEKILKVRACGNRLLPGFTKNYTCGERIIMMGQAKSRQSGFKRKYSKYDSKFWHSSLEMSVGMNPFNEFISFFSFLAP
jgi:hypothetical protein